MVLSTEDIWEEFSQRLKLFIVKRVGSEHDAEHDIPSVKADEISLPRFIPTCGSVAIFHRSRAG